MKKDIKTVKGRAPKKKTAKKAAKKITAKLSQPTGPLIRAIRPVLTTGPDPLRILWIPGLGADRRMFSLLLHELKDHLKQPVAHCFLEYPDVMPGEVDSLESLAGLLSQGILPGDEYDLAIGYSLGGMMLQILRMKGLIQAKSCMLISSGFSGDDINPWFLRLADPPAVLRPLRQLAKKTIAFWYPILRSNLSEAKEYAQMFREFSSTILFESPHWLRHWQGVPEPFYTDCLSVHGDKDKVIRLAKVQKRKEPDYTIQGGSHIIFATHAGELAQFISAKMNLSFR